MPLEEREGRRGRSGAYTPVVGASANSSLATVAAIDSAGVDILLPQIFLVGGLITLNVSAQQLYMHPPPIKHELSKKRMFPIAVLILENLHQLSQRR